MALALEKFLFNVIIQTMILTISWSLLSSLLPLSYWQCVQAAVCVFITNQRGSLYWNVLQHLWKNPLKSTGTKREGLLLACNAEHCQGFSQNQLHSEASVSEDTELFWHVLQHKVRNLTTFLATPLKNRRGINYGRWEEWRRGSGTYIFPGARTSPNSLVKVLSVQ